jgi:pimeloyl-ACP methyl ester carboxylesterase
MSLIVVVVAVGLLLVGGVCIAERAVRQARVRAHLSIKSPNGIVEDQYLRIGGIDQWVSIRGDDKGNPILFVLHGGPGCSYSIFTPHIRPWEKHFTIVQWDQRGSGRTLARMKKRNSGPITFEQLTNDAADVAEYARTRLGKERVFLLASSLGSTFGIRLAHRRPDLFYAYIGTDQNVGMVRAREETHRELLKSLRSLGLESGYKAVEQITSDPTQWTIGDYEIVARWTMKSDVRAYHRTMKLLRNAVWYAPTWTLMDVWAFVAGMRYSLEKLLPEIVRYDAWKESLQFKVPVFIFQGDTDVLTTPNLARTYFDDVIAPQKRFALIANAGHFAAFLQPDRFVRELLADVRPLANAPHQAAIV